MTPLPIAAFALLVPAAAFGQSFVETFADGRLDTRRWCACQIDEARAPLRFPRDGEGPRIAIDLHAAGLGGRNCERARCAGGGAVETMGFSPAPAVDEDERDDLGPSFAPADAGGPTLFGRSALPPGGRSPDCPPPGEPLGGEGRCIQRQEIRTQEPRPVAATRQRYEMRLRVDPEPVDGPATRWVIAQWKEEALTQRALDELRRDGDTERGASPLVALRLDGARLHVTVQDGTCRCLVAAAPPTPAWPGTPDWARFPEGFCRETVGPPDPCETSLSLEAEPDAVLPSPVRRWVDLRLSFRSGRADGELIVEADGARVARVTGPLGYELRSDRLGDTKFKFGHYRDFRRTPTLGSPLEVARIAIDASP